MRAIGWAIGTLALLAIASAHAADLSVRIADTHGAAVADAVVTVFHKGGTMDQASQPRARPATRTIDQKDLMFDPYIAIFRPGDKVVFRNSDQTRHHVYSFSPTKAFEFLLVPGQSSAPLTLDKTGVIAVGCNIHDQMISYLYVSDAPWVAQSGVDGHVVFHDLPVGAYDIRAWQPRLRPDKPILVQSMSLTGATDAKTLTFILDLLPDSRPQSDRDRMHDMHH